MEKIKIIHDVVGHTLTVWLTDPKREHISEETSEEIVLMKDSVGRVIGFELLNYEPSSVSESPGLSVETILKTGT